jgi:hypothetical protein
MITSTTSGVWELDDTYAKINAERWRPGIASYELFVWGSNDNGRLGLNDTVSRSSPTQIPGTQWNIISSTGGGTLISKTDGTLWSCGFNANGQLGQNNLTNYSSPIQIPGTQWNNIRGSTAHVYTTKTDGTLWVWGNAAQGRLGLGDATVPSSSPTQVPGTQWSEVFAGKSSAATGFATKTDGTLWAWGYGDYGGLGQNDRIYRSSPVQIPGTQWGYVTAGAQHSVAIKTDGTLWFFGRNGSGQSGQNISAAGIGAYSSPVQIPGTEWSSAASAEYSIIASKSDGTLWAWGYGAYGQLGLNNQTEYSSPVQIPGTQWTSAYDYLSGAYSGYFATKSDGTLWSWGYNGGGRLGQNNLTYYSSPVQIPGTQWSSTQLSNLHGLAIKQVFTY